MAKDDYNLLVCKILLYLYQCLKNGEAPTKNGLLLGCRLGELADGYRDFILRSMTEEGLISGLLFVKTWGQDTVCASDIDEVRITSEGIRYLSENSTMQTVIEKLRDTLDFAGLVRSLFP